MSIATHYPHITIDGDGVPRIANSRYKVLHLAGEHYHYGWSGEEMIRQHPDLKPEEVYAALTYFYDHYAEMVRQLGETAARCAAHSGTSSLSRDELLRRKTSAGPS